MARKKRHTAIIVTSFYYPVNFQDTYDKFSELANRERISNSELIVQAIQKYVDVKYPGNPQPPIESFLGGHRSLTMEAKMLSTEIRKMVGQLKGDGTEPFKRVIRERKLPKPLIRLVRLNEKLLDPELTALIDEAEKTLF